MTPEQQTVIEWLKQIQRAVTERADQTDAKIERLRTELNGRVRRLETDRGKFVGALVVVSALASGLWTALTRWVGGN